ncbi:hypothetical protein A2631_03745 [Candidatus Daviesbacteria bacterium RIFCSPHIGHO2_01_FULL_44_29]|uniref:Uncharacterized protein n=1 Tax=Candidatus Daviesbacteria bacterium RIFCSPHIGHO2_02_FULL_43_12 TaxID=1797776 RepID=A0A1F5KIN0_9BACT|nr:MAG: hypothetical protein A2631_03745 [Candidatus Daviesbacteria bacterium RIFCSPHIGHO2_01_FULL_44_29]OGE39815.1 MAG: hypothetical protein A3E86_04565 [Candidatus Daviesbacteria bacterium RIFCSPHIGHO2_12_FULL_47_45]OGE40471.1 MAG: hypothetical protein A3D25_00205 [Candidatus Daviesbacteria bacterium RIFCSPHIGHO2_02_FULL_43_12]OGE70022.1 MAG: hypothetical protein A3B55_05005 [Candidatus Daviesbacteria bacterium RIFCSPLOWO2_01_FULL_43_15]
MEIIEKSIFKTIQQRLTLNKRQKIVAASLIVTIGLMYTQNVPIFVRTKFIMWLGALSLIMSLWALWEGMNRVKAFTLLLLPALFTLGVSSFYFLLPIRWLTRVPVDIIFGLMFYFLLLSQNVLNVAAARTIPLYRAASTAAFIFSITTSVLLFHILHAFSLEFYWNGLASLMISFLLSVPMLWSVEMENLSLKILMYSLVTSVLIGELAMALSFWPVPSNSLMWAIFLASSLFILLGINLDFLRERLSRREGWLYISFGIMTLLVMLVTTSWTG